MKVTPAALAASHMPGGSPSALHRHSPGLSGAGESGGICPTQREALGARAKGAAPKGSGVLCPDH